LLGCLQEDYVVRVAQACELVMHQRRHHRSIAAELLPELETAKFAVLLMLHGSGWPNHALWELWQSRHPPGEVAMLMHMKVGGQGGRGRLLCLAMQCHMHISTACTGQHWFNAAGDVSATWRYGRTSSMYHHLLSISQHDVSAVASWVAGWRGCGPRHAWC
jgi:hypothetical protein